MCGISCLRERAKRQGKRYCKKCGEIKELQEFPDFIKLSDRKFSCLDCLDNRIIQNVELAKSGRKICLNCNETKDLEDFYKSIRSSKCITCIKEHRELKALQKRHKLNEKTCESCGKCKGVQDFLKSDTHKDGYTSLCRDCKNAKRRDRNHPRRTSGTKKCYKCSCVLQVEEFRTLKRNTDGLQDKCKYCEDIYCKDRLAKHPEKFKYHVAKRRAKLKNQACDHPECSDKIKQIYAHCPEGYEVDHIHPLDRGGKHCSHNLCYLPRSFNRSKSNKLLEEDQNLKKEFEKKGKIL